MSAFLESIINRAKQDKKTIVLPEGDDPRTLEAAERVLADGIANLIVLGDADAINANGRNLEGARIIDPRTSDLKEELATGLYECRKHKGMTEEKA
ncbi:MAG: phosphate acetyltransferase, partial [Eggerthellaceae bacterium]|nr:phosphate acetyltransferase [Eggerthellaceae bacterium]